MTIGHDDGLLTISSDDISLTVDPRTGSLTSIIDDRTGWEAAGGQFPLSFHMHVPTSARRSNFVRGEDQSSPTIGGDATSLRLVWNGVTSTLGLTHEIEIAETISIDGPLVTFQFAVDNRSDLVIESIAAPRLAEVASAARSQHLRMYSPMYGTAEVREVWPRFDANVGYWGTFHPTLIPKRLSLSGLESFAPQTPFVLLQHEDRGLYVGVRDFERELVAWWAELHPAYADSMVLTPADESHVMFQVVHVPWIQPGEQRSLTPIGLQLYAGDWHTGADIHRNWRRQHLHPADPPSWMKDPHTWHQLHVNGPEDELHRSFEDLIEIAREDGTAGVRVLEIDGWNVGGQDRNNPSHEPDPQLGGADGLAKAIRAIQEVGVRVVLFTKFTWADRSRPDYFESFHRFAIKTPFGHENIHSGYPYTSASQLLGVRVNRLVPMCFFSEEWIQECERQMEHVLAVRPDGILYDECFHHSPAYLCFDENHGHRPGAPVYAADGPFIRRLQAMNEDSDFFWGGEGLYDFQASEYSLSYIRSNSLGHLPFGRYLNPNANMLTAVTGLDDRNIVNQALLYRYVVCYEPFGFKGRLQDMPQTVEYSGRMNSLRTDLREWFWDGEFRDTLGVSVQRANGEPHHPYAVYRSKDSGTLGLAVANYEPNPVGIKPNLPEVEGGWSYRLVDGDDWSPLGDEIELGARSAAVVVTTSALHGLTDAQRARLA